MARVSTLLGTPDSYIFGRSNTHIIYSFAPHQKSLRFLQCLIHDIICYNFVFLFVGTVDKYDGNGTKCDPEYIGLGRRIKTYDLVEISFVDTLITRAMLLNMLSENQAAAQPPQQL